MRYIRPYTFAVSDFSKDVRLPIQLQRAMAAEAEATREAKAKVTVQLPRHPHDAH